MPIVQFDTENADLDLTSQVTCLTDTPDAANPVQCQALVDLGDGTKNLDGTGGDFEMTIELGSQTVEPDPQTIAVSAGQTRASIASEPFVVPANVQVVIKVKSPNAGDSDVDVTAYLFDVHPLSTALVNAEVDTALSDYDPPTDAELTAGLAGLNDPTTAAIADQVWDEAKAGHVGGGSFGEEVQAHSLSSEIAALNNLSVADIRDMVIEGALTLRGVLRIILAFVAGKASGGATTSIAFRNQADTLNRILMTTDASGNRSAVVVDGS